MTRIEFFENVLRDWLAHEDLTLFAGDWCDGAIMELCPAGKARLTGARYDEPFGGLRDIVLPGAGPHGHLDLGRFAQLVYRVAPSVCFGWKPAFEILFLTDDTPPRVGFRCGHGRPYDRSGTLAATVVDEFFGRHAEHARQRPELVRIEVERPAVPQRHAEVWRSIEERLCDA